MPAECINATSIRPALPKVPAPSEARPKKTVAAKGEIEPPSRGFQFKSNNA